MSAVLRLDLIKYYLIPHCQINKDQQLILIEVELTDMHQSIFFFF